MHRTTYVWKEDEGYAIIIKNDGNKVILNQDATKLWKIINDEDSVEIICDLIKEKYNISEDKTLIAIKALIEAGVVSNLDMFWGD
ncbi:PqqD family peptide modification chaperone [Ruminiclostridium herbifermentans]|uniref:PqqD family peptide modification chaperone n=1 Tax=Ruminiclostridium herbifermentans TaxID=2488810 RepID=UPI0014852B7E|nr:PqqD family peptide modification chaperone [Ruminiclostridium herbifermentans]